ncbi:hypothetical protein [Streptomyces colonosanans]|uniref:Uncharacterized protein n=1 Tax=Streptomyces colonosanans TaxID=1428652 RepID=A0A1S2PCZ0_9ACTN|nr:hypothetical protein [Streptomyces colonosanans]OIJ91452.1 hypothetical protein BIV24_16085 [Streptomyces colonosanans]
MPVRDFGGIGPARRTVHAPFERQVQLALLWTAFDRPVEWLRAGQALECVLLVASTHSVRTSPPSA